MPRSFRLVPPEPRSDVLPRPRLLQALAGRWDHRVTSITGGPGLGKTTLLAQAVADNLRAPRGEDVWVGLEPHDADGDRLSRAVAAALSDDERRSETSVVEGDVAPPPSAVADALWHRSPSEACLLLDDVHLLPEGSGGAAWLAELVTLLPANGHVVLSSRADPPIPLTRLGTLGGVLWLYEDDLRFSSGELASYADLRGVDPGRLGATGGWPAMAELVATVGAAPATSAAPTTPASEATPAAPATPAPMTSASEATSAAPATPAAPATSAAPTTPASEATSATPATSAAPTTPASEATPATPAAGGSAATDAGARSASAPEAAPSGYLWDEVLQPLGSVRRRVLAVLCDLGGADDALASAAVGAPVDLAEALDGIPLVARGTDGWFRPHALWQDAPGLGLTDDQRAEVRQRAADELVGRTRYDDAFTLLGEAGLWDAVPRVLRAACLAAETLEANQLGRWLDASPPSVRSSTAGRLATGLHLAYTAPFEAIDPLRNAAELFRAADDIDAELAAIGQIGRLAWWWQDVDLIRGLSQRVFELDQTGHPKAASLAAFGWALVADMGGDDQLVLSYLARIEPGVLDPGWEILARWYEGLIRLYLGQPAATRIIVDSLATADPAMGYVVETLELMVLWAIGHVEAVLDRTPAVIAAGRASGVTYSLSLGMTTASLGYSHTGDVEASRSCLAEGLAAAPPVMEGELSVHASLATASLQLAEGDEEAATRTLHQAMQIYGVDRGTDRRWWRQDLALSYVLLPEARAMWDELDLRGHLATARSLGAAVVTLRQTGDPAPLRGLDVPNVGVARAALHHRFAAELAVGLSALGRPEGRQLLDVLGPPGRDSVRALARRDETRLGKAAKALLAAVPAPPRRSAHLSVLGPLALRRDDRHGDDVGAPDLRRVRLQELLAFLVGHRRTTRGAIIATLWPDLDERAAANNLGVTLNHLLRLLEPWRARGEPAYLVRLEGNGVELVTGEHLRIDVDEFDAHVTAAARAELDGMPSVALERHRAAVELYRDDLFVELPEADWFTLEREHHRSRFVASAVRAGELLLGRGDVEDAEDVAKRALAVDRCSETAYAVLVGAALARGDRAAAQVILDRSLQVLDDLGAQPSAATEQLRRRVVGPAEAD